MLPTIVMKGRANLSEPRLLSVLVRQGYLIARKLPVNRQRRVVPSDAAVAFGRIVGGDLVNYLAVVFERNIAVRKSDRHPQLLPIAFRKLDTDMLAEGGRSHADVYANIKDSTPSASDELSLRLRRQLKMQPA